MPGVLQDMHASLWEQGSTGAVASAATGAHTPTAGRLQLLWVGSQRTGAVAPVAPTVTGAGLTWVQVASVVVSTGTFKDRLSVFRAMGAGANGALTIDFAGASQSQIQWVWEEIDNVDTSGANGAGAVAGSATASGATAFLGSIDAGTLTDLNQRVAAGIAHNTGEGSSVAGVDSAETADIFSIGASLAVEVQLASTDVVAASWTTSSQWGAIGLILNSSAPYGAIPNDVPELHLELSTASPTAAAQTWQDISGDLRHFRVGPEGKQFELDAGVTAVHEYTLDNSSGNYRMFNTVGLWYPNLKPKRRVRLWMIWKGLKYFLAEGRITSIVPTREGNYSEVVMKCASVFQHFAIRAMLPGTATLATNTGVADTDLIYTSSGGGSSPGVARVYGGAWFPMTQPAGSGGSPAGALSVQYVVAGNSTPLSVDYDPSTGLITVGLATDSGGAPASHAKSVLSALRNSVSVRSVVDIQPGVGWSTGQGVMPAMGATPLVGGYPAELAGSRINRVLDSIGWPLGLRAIDAGVTTVQAVTFGISDNVRALQHMQDVMLGEIGALFVDGRSRLVMHDRNRRSSAPYNAPSVTLSDAPGAGAYGYAGIVPSADDSRLSNNIIGSRNNGGSVTVSDAASIADFDQLDYTIQTLYSSDAQVTTLVNLLLARYKDPHLRYDSVTLDPMSGDGLWDWIAQLGISNQVTIEEHPPGSSVLSSNHYIESVEHEGDGPGADKVRWTTTYALSPV